MQRNQWPETLIEKPKPGYVADWQDWPEWQRNTDMDIFAAIELAIQQEVAQV